MFQLILPVLLGLLLLFVLLLLISELVTTYPVWKQFKDFYSAQNAVLAPNDKKSIPPWNVLLFLSAGAVLICLLVYSFAHQKEKMLTPSAGKTNSTAAGPARPFTASSADRSVFFRLHTKWEDGKLYGNSTITFADLAAKPLADCRYYFLDKEGFLIKAISFSSNDFVFSTGPDGKAHSLLHKFNSELSQDEYLKIEKLQVVIDGKLPDEEPNRLSNR